MESIYFFKTLTQTIGYKITCKNDNFVAMIKRRFISQLQLTLFLMSGLLIQGVTHAQTVVAITQIESPAIETSGLIRTDGKTITHNDSGGEAALYEIDTLNGQVSRTVEILSSTNIDWEALCMDDNYIYIGDFGNNQGTRTNLRIYKISKEDYLDEGNTAVNAEIISFIYEDQDDFTPSQFTTNFDAEAVIVKNQMLYIFTKNWGNGWSNIYVLPTTPGSHLANRVDSINTEGMVTDASYSATDDRITLVGYTTILEPFVFEIENIGDQLFSQSELTRTNISFPSGYSRQVEGISHIVGENYLLSTEEGITGNSGLFSLIMGEPNSIAENLGVDILIYPNPASDIIYLKSDEPLKFELLNLKGKVVKQTASNQINLKGLASGTYLISVQNLQGIEIKREKIVVL